jgi:hypothetical protein
MHDQRFKRLLQEFFAEFLQLFFPEWAARFDFSGIEWHDKELLSDVGEGESRYVDLLAKLPTREPIPGPDGRSAESWLALVHVEVEAADTVAPLRRRMFHYYEPLRRSHDLPVLPIGLYLRVGLEGVGWDTYEERFWEHQLVRFNYPYVGLPALDADQYVRGDNWLGVALAALMRVPKERRMQLAGEALERIVHCPENLYRRTLLCECITAYLPADDEQRRQFEDMVRNHPDPGVRTMELGLLDHVEQRALQQGKMEGKLEGQREMLREQLETRFGTLSSTVVAQIEALPADRLRELGRALVSADSLEQLGLGASG